MRTDRSPQLDGIRGIAILTILVYHYVYGQIAERPLGPILHGVEAGLRLGWAGVDLFFVLSGFLIGGILLDHRESPTYYGTFYVRRAARILPLYLLLLAGLYVGVQLHAWPWLFARPQPWIAYALFLQNHWTAASGAFVPGWTAVTWSLAIEEQFYLVLPLLLRWVKPASHVPVLVGAILLAPMVRAAILLFHIGDPQTAAFVLFPARMDTLFLGVLLAVLLRDRHRALDLLTNRWTVAALTLAVMTLVFHSPRWKPIPAVVGYSLVALLCGAVLMKAVREPAGLFGRITSWRWLRYMGVRAYGLYLFHTPILGVTFGVLQGERQNLQSRAALGTALLALVLTFVAAAVSYRFLETPLLNWGKRFLYATPPSAAPREVPAGGV